MRVRADFHIHSVLSPCGSLEMSPADIVKAALAAGLDAAAVSDHNSAKNLRAFHDAAAGKINILYGLEIQALSETHLLALFDQLETAEAFGDFIHTHLPDIPNDPEYFGDQVVVNADNTIAGFEEKLLIQSVDLDEEEIISEIHERGGLAFFSHIDRDTFSIISQLGFIPDDTAVDGVEISSALSIDEARTLYKQYAHIPFIANSDAHYLRDVGRSCTIYEIEKFTLDEIRMALRGEEGRRVIA